MFDVPVSKYRTSIVKILGAYFVVIISVNVLVLNIKIYS